MNVSVIVPMFNAERYIGETIRSIKAQTMSEWEAIIVDDGSTDQSLQMAREAIEGDVRFKIFTRENRGVVDTLNQALQEARGRLIARLDADDVAAPDRLASQAQFLAEHPSVGLLGGQCVEIDTTGELLNGGRVSRLPERPSEVCRALQKGCAIVSSTAMFRAEVLAKTGGFRRPFASVEDYDLWLRMSEIAEVANLGACLVLYRVHGNSLSRTRASYQALFTEVVKICGEYRRRGEPDPVGDRGEVSASLLAQLGLDDNRIRKIEFRGLRSTASQSLLRGAVTEAARLLDEGGRYLSHADAEDQVEFDILLRRLALAERRYASAFGRPGAIIRQPRRYMLTLWGKLARRIGA